MDAATKKTVLRMIPYGIYVMTAKSGDGQIAAATVNFVTQTSFAPPLVAVGVKVDSGCHLAAKESGQFALNMLGKGQQGAAFAFFKPAEVEDGKLSGEPFRPGDNGAPIIDSAIGAVECKVVEIVALGDHYVILGEVTQVHLHKHPEGRPDAAILKMKDLGENVFYGG